MRISDWSSDVCSSDLPGLGEDGERELDGHLHDEQARDVGQDVLEGDARAALAGDPGGQHEVALPQRPRGAARQAREDRDGEDADGDDGIDGTGAEDRGDHPRRESSDERSVGTEWGSTCRSWWSPYH